MHGPTPFSAPVVVFDDSHVASDVRLAPVNDLREAGEIRTGFLTTLERLERRLSPPVARFVPPDLARITRERRAEPPVNELLALDRVGNRPILLVNARAPLGYLAARSVKPGEGVLAAGGSLVAAVCEAPTAAAFLRALLAGDPAPLPPVQTRGVGTAEHEVVAARVLHRPWHVRAMRDACLSDDLAHEIPLRLAARQSTPPLPAGVTVVGRHPVFIHPAASIFPSAVVDASGGPVLIDEHATVRPGSILIGPCAIGIHSTVLDRAVIRPGTAIGPWCKVAGEVGGTIFQGFANKAHDGYLGDSFVGEWVNLGAGTTNSNLLNTYGEIVARPLERSAGPAGSNERTGETFLGCVLGDHVKTAIGTRIMTGSIVGTGTMFAGSAPLAGTVPAYSWITDAGSKAYRFDKFLEVAQAAMTRRNVKPGPAYVERLKSLTANGS